MKKSLLFLLLLFVGFPVRMSAVSQKEVEEEQFYKDWYNQVIYTLDNVSTRKALTMIEDLRDHAEQHDSKYGFFIATFLNAHVAKDMGMLDQAEELLLQAAEYRKRYLPGIKPKIQFYEFLVSLYEERGEGEKAIQVIDRALNLPDWEDEDRISLLSMKCNAVTTIEPVDTARFMKYYAVMHDLIETSHYTGHQHEYTECYFAQYSRNYAELLALAQNVTDRRVRLRFQVAAFVGLGRKQEALDSLKAYKTWTKEQYNAETRKMAEMNALELESARAENEADTLRLTNQRQMLTAIVCLLVLTALFLAIYLYRRIRMTRQLKRAYVHLEQAYDQVETLTRQKERIDSELRIARDIQMSMVPTDFAIQEGLEIYGSMTPAKEVGGDLYDFFVHDGLLYFCIGDVSDKSVPAALFMTVSKSLFRAYASDGMSPDQIAERMNHTLGENNKTCMFVTFFIGILDPRSGVLRYCNAGHEVPVIINTEAQPLPVERNMFLGVYDGIPYQMQETVISPGTTLLLYTDGLTEAMNAADKMFSEERVYDEINRAIKAGLTAPKALIERLSQAVHNFVGETPQSDDLTLLAIRT